MIWNRGTPNLVYIQLVISLQKEDFTWATKEKYFSKLKKIEGSNSWPNEHSWELNDSKDVPIS